jgi:hypothetical protein
VVSPIIVPQTFRCRELVGHSPWSGFSFSKSDCPTKRVFDVAYLVQFGKRGSNTFCFLGFFDVPAPLDVFSYSFVRRVFQRSVSIVGYVLTVHECRTRVKTVCLSGGYNVHYNRWQRNERFRIECDGIMSGTHKSENSIALPIHCLCRQLPALFFHLW